MNKITHLPSRSDGSVLGHVVSLVAGAILGVAASKFVDKASLLVAALASAAVILAAILAFSALVLGRRQATTIDELTTELIRVRNQLGEPADLTFERFDTSTGEYFRRLSQIVTQLQPGDYVYVMTHHDRPVNESAERNETHAAARKVYLDLLLQKAREGVAYKRTMCFEPDGEDVPVRLTHLRQHLREHCLALLDVAATRPTTIAVKKAPALLMTDIFIATQHMGGVPHCIGAISMETYAQSARLYTAGALIVHDPPNAKIIEHLHAWWNEADGNSAAVRKNDLSEKTMPPSAG